MIMLCKVYLMPVFLDALLRNWVTVIGGIGEIMGLLAVGWKVRKYVRERPRLIVELAQQYDIDFKTTPPTKTWSLMLRIRNDGHRSIIVADWDMRPTKGEGPWAVEITGLPKELHSFGDAIEIPVQSDLICSREPDRVWVTDSYKRRWYVKKASIKQTVADAKLHASS